MSAFLLFSQGRRRRVKQENPDMKNTEISSLLGEMWRESTDEERRPFVERELGLREKYKVDLAEWKEKEEERKEEEMKQRKAQMEWQKEQQEQAMKQAQQYAQQPALHQQGVPQMHPYSPYMHQPPQQQPQGYPVYQHPPGYMAHFGTLPLFEMF